MSNIRRSIHSWSTPTRAWPWIGLVLLVVAGAACTGGDTSKSPTPTTVVPTSTAPNTASTVTLRGDLTLDGAPLESQFLGVRVIRDGLAAACQDTIPAVTQGRYEVTVAADAEVRGCGAPGAAILLWAYANGGFIFSTGTTPWPGKAAATTFNAAFSSRTPAGASQPVTEFKGHLFARDGSELPGGTVVEAFVGKVRCAVTSLRYGDAVEGFYTLIVASSASVPGCTPGGTLEFRLDGKPAAETAINDLGSGAEGHELNLSLK